MQVGARLDPAHFIGPLSLYFYRLFCVEERLFHFLLLLYRVRLSGALHSPRKYVYTSLACHKAQERTLGLTDKLYPESRLKVEVFLLGLGPPRGSTRKDSWGSYCVFP